MRIILNARDFLVETIRRSAQCRKGVAAVEFGLLVPILMLMLVGTYEASRMVSTDRRFNTVTAMLGDLVSREQDMGRTPSENVATINSMMKVARHIMGPYPDDTLEIEVIPVMISEDGSRTSLYAPSYKYAGGAVSLQKPRCTDYSLPNGLVAPGGKAIVVEAKYTYVTSSFATWLYGNTAQWSDKVTHSPRHSCVDFEANNCIVSC